MSISCSRPASGVGCRRWERFDGWTQRCVCMRRDRAALGGCALRVCMLMSCGVMVWQAHCKFNFMREITDRRFSDCYAVVAMQAGGSCCA
jgi:hypothetical protein